VQLSCAQQTHRWRLQTCPPCQQACKWPSDNASASHLTPTRQRFNDKNLSPRQFEHTHTLLPKKLKGSHTRSHIIAREGSILCPMHTRESLGEFAWPDLHTRRLATSLKHDMNQHSIYWLSQTSSKAWTFLTCIEKCQLDKIILCRSVRCVVSRSTSFHVDVAC
jgi:hypothetical protein